MFFCQSVFFQKVFRRLNSATDSSEIGFPLRFSYLSNIITADYDKVEIKRRLPLALNNFLALFFKPAAMALGNKRGVIRA